MIVKLAIPVVTLQLACAVRDYCQREKMPDYAIEKVVYDQNNGKCLVDLRITNVSLISGINQFPLRGVLFRDIARPLVTLTETSIDVTK